MLRSTDGKVVGWQIFWPNVTNSLMIRDLSIVKPRLPRASSLYS